MSEVRVRPARAAELPLLVEVELASDGPFHDAGIGPLPPPGSAEELAEARCVLVAGDPPVGFARLGEVDGLAHLEQLSVHPGHSGRGIGTALLEAACTWAAGSGYQAMTLTTFADVPWNAPYYARRGFTELTLLTPGLQEIRTHEAELGLDVLGRRIAMRRALAASRG
ncbi:GNAT family N-acetyltransferase [Catellatospora bangladeshensis]|uniref:GCN5 family N-acetyltransferase n=1 Tax=Catellatospora bangladeshensis TaxID=310355 RepID=A0A8J3JUQ3_9ACTN|nr:GNAT family N-acetyltransferase [Catellatospora bangladeshensis]GIF84064.1 GCN5 family N-acetyltransferase [Catellatospora bangladeshensis]